MGKKLCTKGNDKTDKPTKKKYACKKCGLKANKEHKLCKPDMKL